MSVDTKATRTADQWREAIHRSLPGPDGDGATARAVAEAVGLGYSTTTAYLRSMAVDGRVESTKEGRNTVWRKLDPSPTMTKDDVPTPRAAVVAPTGDGRPAAEAKRAKRNRAKADETAATLAADDAPTPTDVEMVWQAVQRKGINYHRPADTGSGLTVCGRSMRTGVRVALADVRETSAKCRQCYPTLRHAPALPAVESDAGTPEPVAVPQPPAAARTPAGGALGDVVGYLEAVRPVSPAPPVTPKATRTRRDPDAPRPAWTVWAPGGLQAAILAAAQAMNEGAVFGANEMARQLNSQPGSVTFAINSLITKGNLIKATDKPPRFKAA